MKKAFIICSFLVLFASSASFGQKTPEVKRAIELIEIGDAASAVSAMSAYTATNSKNAEGYAGLAMAQLTVGNTAEADKAMEKAFDIDRKNVFVRNVRGMLFGKQGKIDEAIKEFRQAIKYDEKDVSSYFYLSRYYLSLDSLKAAEVTLYRAQGVDQNDVRSYLGLGELYEKQRIPDLAIKQYEEAKKLNQQDITVLAKIARLYTKKKDYSAAANEWIKLTSIDSTYAPAYYEIANLFYIGEQYSRTVAYAEKFLSLKPNDLKGVWLLARALSETNQYQKAIPYLEEAAKNDSLRPYTELFRARGYFFNKEFGKANEIFGNAKNLDPNDMYYYGYSLISSGDSLGGVEKWKQSLVNDTVRSEEAKRKVEKQIVGVYTTMKKYDLAADMYMTMAKTSNANENYINAGQLYNFAGKPEEAAKAFQLVLDKDPNSIRAMVGLADALMKDPAKENDVKMYLDKAAGLAAGETDKDAVGGGYGRYGQKLLMDKEYAKSIEPLQKAEKILSDKAPIKCNVYLFMGISYVQLKKNDQAREYLNKALKCDPKSDIAKKQLEFLDSLKKTDTKK
jgi:tetratricopeptide (TPR) repeat protein